MKDLAKIGLSRKGRTEPEKLREFEELQRKKAKIRRAKVKLTREVKKLKR